MKLRYLPISVALLLLPLPTSAQQVFGRVTEGPQTAAGGATVVVSCGDDTVTSSATTDGGGLYRLTAPATGQCTLTVEYQGMVSNRIRVRVSNRRTQVNLEIWSRDGGWFLRKS